LTNTAPHAASQGSLKLSVDAMRKYQKHVNVTLSIGIVSFHLTAMTYAWVMLRQVVWQCGDVRCRLASSLRGHHPIGQMHV
jgi:hypothetical protein